MTYEQLIYDQFPFVQCPLECLEGWHELIYKMCVEVDDYLFTNQLSEEFDDYEFSILQIKEKFGILNVTTTVWLDDIIKKYIELSKHTCEICGAEGKMINDGYWIKVRCEGCL